jgi:hypothetical protein
MFHYGFSKVAETKRERQERIHKSVLYGSAGAIAGSVAGTGSALGALVPRSKNSHLTEDAFHKIKKSDGLHTTSLNMGHDNIVGRVNSSLNYAFGHGPNTKNPKFVVSTAPSAGPSVMAHEMGHAKHWQGMSSSRMKLHDKLRNFGPYAGIGAGGMMALSDNEKARKFAPVAVLAGSAPMVYQEGVATAHALRNLKKHYGNKVALRGAGRLGLAFGSYVLPPVGIAAGLHYANKKRKKKDV